MATFGVIVGNRGFFPSHLAESGRRDILAVLEKQGHKAITLSPERAYGTVETNVEARMCADLFRQHRDEIDGILITLPNFGEERPIANTVRWSDLDVPILVQATPDDFSKMTIKDRRDSFCGKMSTCNNLRQYGYDYSLTRLHTVSPTSDEFAVDLERFAATCRVVKSLRNARLGAVGARPAAFNTVRYSEKLLEQSGITVETIDLSEILGWANRFGESDALVQEKLEAMCSYTDVQGIPRESLVRMAKLGAALDKFVTENGLVATAIQCWTALEEFYGVVPCTLMSMMSNSLLPSACETDVAGLVGMYVLQAASETPAALLDWNNNYGDDPDKAVVFHCSNLPKAFFMNHKMDYQEIIAGTVGKENTFGTIVGQVAPGPVTYCRVSTDDTRGVVRSYVGEGQFTNDRLLTFGGYGIVQIPRFQDLLQMICRNGYEHHVAATRAEVADAIYDALATYKKWDVYKHA